MSFQIISDQTKLADLIQQLSCSEIVYLDTEFVRERSLTPHFGLLQISDGNSVWLIDPLTLDDLSQLWALLQSPERLVVLHAFGEDLELLWNEGRVELNHVLDTQVAAAILNWGAGMGFAALVERVTGVELDKSHSRTNWLQRPLSEQQLTYAADDVLYLAPVAQQLMQELQEQGLWDVCLAECRRLAKRSDKPLAKRYLDVKNGWQLQPQQLAVLRELAAWRYEQARARDMALNFVIKDIALIAIAKYQPDSMNKLKQLSDVAPIEARIHGARLLKLVAEGQLIEKSDWPETIYRVIDIPHYKQKQKSLARLLKEIAQKQGIPETVLASKRFHSEYLMWQWQLNQGRSVASEPVLLQGWRKSLLEEPLAHWLSEQKN